MLTRYKAREREGWPRLILRCLCNVETDVMKQMPLAGILMAILWKQLVFGEKKEA